jgi:hypothetical protein
MQITSLFPRGPGPRTRDDDAVADPPAEAKVQVLNQQAVAAVRTNDAEWFSRNLADDAVIVLRGGQRLRKLDFLEMLQNAPKLNRSLVVQDVTARTFGSMTQVDAVASWEMADGTSGVSRYLDTWVRLGGRWQMVSAQVTSLME